MAAPPTQEPWLETHLKRMELFVTQAEAAHAKKEEEAQFLKNTQWLKMHRALELPDYMFEPQEPQLSHIRLKRQPDLSPPAWRQMMNSNPQTRTNPTAAGSDQQLYTCITCSAKRIRMMPSQNPQAFQCIGCTLDSVDSQHSTSSRTLQRPEDILPGDERAGAAPELEQSRQLDALDAAGPGGADSGGQA